MCPAETHLLHNFYKTIRACGQLHAWSTVKIWWHLSLSKGFRSYEGLKLRESQFLQIFSTPSGETTHLIPKCFEEPERAQGPLLPCQIWWGWNLACHWGTQKSQVSCLSVCWFIMLFNDIANANHFAQKSLEYGNDFDVVGEVNIRSGAPAFTSSVCCQVMPPKDIRVENGIKLGVLPLTRAKE